MLEVEQLSGGYSGVTVLCNIHFKAEPGEFVGIIGPNGSGKSTLLKMLYRELHPETGTINLNGTPLDSLTQKQIAAQLAVLPQQEEEAFSYTVCEVVELGRYPYQKGWFGRTSRQDREVVEEAMRQTYVDHAAHRTLDQLSGGEKQRVYLARAMAQEPDYLLLDEPTNHLDIAYQVHLLDTLKQWAAKKQMTVIAAIHDLNLAALYSDKLLLLNKGNQELLDEPSNVLKKQLLQRVYGTALSRVIHPFAPRPQLMLEPDHLTGNIINGPLETLQKEEINNELYVTSAMDWKTLSSAGEENGFIWARTFSLSMENWARKKAAFEGLDVSSSDMHVEEDMDGCIKVYTAVINKVGGADAGWTYRPDFVCILLFIDSELNEGEMAGVLAAAAEAKGQAAVDTVHNREIMFGEGPVTVAVSGQRSSIDTQEEIRRRSARLVYNRLR
ncbi:ABC transporter ATP-binding protein [Salibacterium qingdaonense]|uniref:Iron complex transport system ATP-binding protein n=1 Tax=Salibacterium qingdaonense TaxID=266892 RepID=A0A1I4M6A1_9BACI|nr:ABC transporter ATP-binding protein [Salibacterium qingdaonense]SFL98791.1 iron complex transport system ATP-binding protein [Salibacterium qingdaonense]